MQIDDYVYAPAGLVQAVDHLIDFKNKCDVWTTIKEVVKVWEKLSPKEYKSFLITHQDLKETRKKYNIGTSTFSGVSYDRETGGYIKYALDIPEKVVLMIRRLYPVEDLPFNKEFYRKFGRKFPQFRIMERSK